MVVDDKLNKSNNSDDKQSADNIADAKVSTGSAANQSPMSSNNKSPLSKLKKKKVWIPAVVAVVLLLVLLFVPLVPRKLPKVSELRPITLSDVSIATKFESPQKLVQQATQDLDGRVKEATDNKGSYGLDAGGLAVYKLPYHALQGQQFSVQPTEAYGVAFDGGIDQSDVNYQKLAKFFDANHFVRLASNDGQKGYIGESKAVTFESYAAYVSGEQLCAIWRAEITKTPEITQRVSVGCAMLENYAKAAGSVAPFYDSYSKTDGKHDSLLVFGAPDIAQGANGYQRAALYQEDSHGADQANSGKYAFQAIYYKAPNSKTWQYFGRVSIDTDETIECSKVNTGVLRQAFSGMGCYDQATKKNNTI